LLWLGPQAPVDGVYYVACNIRIDSATEARYIRVILDVSSDGGDKHRNGLHHIRSNIPPYYSANPSGELRATLTLASKAVRLVASHSLNRVCKKEDCVLEKK
jgi:hypothetical protein